MSSETDVHETVTDENRVQNQYDECGDLDRDV